MVRGFNWRERVALFFLSGLGKVLCRSLRCRWLPFRLNETFYGFGWACLMCRWSICERSAARVSGGRRP